MKQLQYTIKEKELKPMGYIYQKLYADDRKSYRLEIEKWSYTIWLWVIGKSIQVNDWYDNTHAIIVFYNGNRNNEIFLDKDYVDIALNRNTSEIIINTCWEELNVIMTTNDAEGFKVLKEKYKDTDEIRLYKDKMDRVVIELEKLKPILV